MTQAWAPIATKRSYRIIARIVDDERVAGLDEPARHRLSHIAEADKSDVHEVSSCQVKCEGATLPEHR